MCISYINRLKSAPKAPNILGNFWPFNPPPLVMAAFGTRGGGFLFELPPIVGIPNTITIIIPKQKFFEIPRWLRWSDERVVYGDFHAHVCLTASLLLVDSFRNHPDFVGNVIQ